MVENWAVVGAGLSSASFLRGFAIASSAYPKSKLPNVTILHHSDVDGEANSVDSVPISGKKVAIPGFFSVPPGQKIHSNLANGLSGSQNFGGWSQKWGATWFPPLDSDLALWPEEIRLNLIEGLKAVEDTYSVVGPKRASLRRPARGLPARVSPSFMERQAQNLPPELRFSPSSLFIAPLAADQTEGCNQCGQCLTGCPAGHIWNALDEIKRLQEHLGFGVISNFSVTKIVPAAGRFLIVGFGEGDRRRELQFDRVFLGAGPLQTGCILARSELAVEPLIVRETAMFAVPFMRVDGRKTVVDEVPRIGLSEGFLTEDRGRSSDKAPRFFAQLYGDSAELRKKITSESRIAGALPAWLQKAIFARIGVAMVFVRQDRSPSIRVTVAGQAATIYSSSGESPFSPLVKFTLAMRRAGLIALLPLLRPAPAGHSYHLGASFPLADDAIAPLDLNTTNSLGEPNGHSKIHLIDGSGLPVVPPTPVSGLVMANNFRLAKAVLKNVLSA